MLRKRRNRYHHGDLHRQAVATAVRVIETKGLARLSMREVARELGVVHASLYEHFATRRDLLAAVAEDGFRELARRMQRAGRRAEDPLASLTALAVAYVRFGVERATYLAVMNDPELTGGVERSGLVEAHRAVVSLLTEYVEKCQETGALAAGDPLEIGLTLWVYAYGYVELNRTGRGFYYPPLHRPRSRAAVERHFRETFAQVLRSFAGPED